MSDHGENIVRLANELLRGDSYVAPETPRPKIHLTFRALCLTTILTALGSSAVTLWASETQRPLTRYERTELEALVFYAVHAKGLKEDIVRLNMQTDLGVDTFDDMTERDYIIARRYLQNIAQ